MVERGRIMAAVARKSVIVPMIFALTLLAVTVFVPKAEALNEPVNPGNDRITGLWNTGVDNNGDMLDMPGPWGSPTPAPATSAPWNNEYRAAPYSISNSDIIQDPNWRLVAIDRPDNGTPNNPADDPSHCQNFAGARQAVVIMPPWDGELNPAGVDGDGDPFDGGFVWWRMSMSDPANQLLNGSFYDRGARWIGARPNSYHDTLGGTGLGQSSPGTCGDNSSSLLGTPQQANVWPTFVYRLEDGFNVGSCVNENTIRLNLYWAADDEFQLVLNEGSPEETVIIPRTLGGGVVTQTGVNAAAFRPGNNTLTVRVRTSFPLTGFALAWEEPTYQCDLPEPYFKVFGNDIAAGGGIEPCDLSSLPNPRATILARARSSGNVGGSVSPPDEITGASGQLGVFALGQIEGFSSGGNQSPRRRNTPQSPVNGLTFGNFGDPAISEGGNNWDTTGTILDPNRVLADGGKGGQFRCIPDYYEIASSSIGGTPQNTNSIDLQSVTSGFYRPAGGQLRISANNPLISGDHTIVVDGDVYLPDDFHYDAYNSPGGIPSVYIIAKGNIYVGKNNREISGVFVAQQIDNPPATGDKGGTIYTCSEGDGASAARPVFQNRLYQDCRSNLTINGAFIANQIRLLRTNGDADNSNENELWSPDDNIAEIFKSSAEVYLSVPDHFKKPTDGNVRYDSITNLPPIL